MQLGHGTDDVLLMMQLNQQVIKELFWIGWHILLFVASVEQLTASIMNIIYVRPHTIYPWVIIILLVIISNQFLGFGVFVFFQALLQKVLFYFYLTCYALLKELILQSLFI